MISIEPRFIQKPETWPVQVNDPLNLAPAMAAEFRMVKLGCSFRGVELFAQVPCHWHPERVEMYVAKFRQAMQR